MVFCCCMGHFVSVSLNMTLATFSSTYLRYWLNISSIYLQFEETATKEDLMAVDETTKKDILDLFMVIDSSLTHSHSFSLPWHVHNHWLFLDTFTINDSSLTSSQSLTLPWHVHDHWLFLDTFMIIDSLFMFCRIII